MKSSYKVLKLKAFKDDSLYKNLKNALREHFSLSLELSDFNILLKQRRIKVKGNAISDAKYELRRDDKFTVSITKSELRKWSLPVKESIKITSDMILHEENIFLIGNKPASISSNATIDSTQDNFLAAITRYISGPHKEKYIALHHRIDFETSGILVFCKKKSYNKYFTELFEKKVIKKTYLALVNDLENSFKDTTVANRLDRDPNNKMKVKSTNSGGKEAKTKFEKIGHIDGKTLVEATPETGRLHQIRVHLSELGYPISGDSIYGKKSEGRTLLHAYKISFPHPESKEIVLFCAPIPEDFPDDITKLVK
ncbi:RluA family pseudouridine synthase [Halobacteriovorax sp.]|uniref:RluA family pseudouridine synthase n=1 Tax=Halobacteriovorax sp. TaxID=2020862 RepID=UPI003561BD8D